MTARKKPTKDARQVLDRYAADTFQNFAAKLGIGTDNMSSANSYGFNPISRVRTLIEWMYRGSWVCGVGVDCVADDMTREGIDILSTLKPDQLERINYTMRRMQIWQSLNQVGKWARLYGGALGVLIIDGQPLSTPLRIETVKPGQFKGIITLDRWMVTPDLNSSVTAPGPEFGCPEWYTIDAQSPNLPLKRQRVHYTRCVRMEGVELPYWQKVSENMWGISVLERLYDRLTAFDSTTQGAAQLAFKSYVRTMSVENLREIIGAGGKALTALTQNMEMIRRFQSSEGLTLIDAKDKFETHTYTFAGMSDIINAMGEQISGALQVPLVRLFGQSPGGMNANGDSDMRTYEDNILRQQERWFRRPLDVIIPLVALNAKVEMPPGWEYEFKSLRQMTDEQKSKITVDTASALTSVDSTGKLPSAVLLKELQALGRKTGVFTNITQKDIDEAVEADKVPSPTELGLVGPDGQPLAPSQPGEEGKPAVPPKPGAQPGTDKVENPDKVTSDRAYLVDVHGIPCLIENHRGTLRRGGKGMFKWQTLMPADYGFIEGVGSAEGKFEQLDCYIGEDTGSKKVWVIDQLNLATGAFDEHKCMMAFKNKTEATDVYIRSFSDGKGKERIGSMTELSIAQFKTWMATGDMTLPLDMSVNKGAA